MAIPRSFNSGARVPNAMPPAATAAREHIGLHPILHQPGHAQSQGPKLPHALALHAIHPPAADKEIVSTAPKPVGAKRRSLSLSMPKPGSML